MTFEELRAMLSSEAGFDQEKALEGIQSLVNEEKQKGITLYQKKDGELLKLKNTIKEAGYDSSQHETLKEYVTSLSKKAATSDEATITINSLNEKISDLTEKFSTSQREQQEAVTMATTESLSSKLTGSLGDKLYGADYVIDSLLRNGDVKKVDDRATWSIDGTELDYDQGLEKFIKQSGDILKSTKTNGTGTPGDSSNIVKDYGEMSVDEATANLDAIKADLGI